MKRRIVILLFSLYVTLCFCEDMKKINGKEIEYIEKAYNFIKDKNKQRLEDYDYEIYYGESNVYVYLFLSKEVQNKMKIAHKGTDICIEMNFDGTNIRQKKAIEEFDE